jgi:hypothetical protein
MSRARPFAYNPSHLTLAGTVNVGDICIGTSLSNVYQANYGGLTWWEGPDETLGYVIAVPVPSNTQPTPYPGVFASVGFWGTTVFGSPFSESTFVGLVNQVFSQTFTTGYDAATWLGTHGYWTNYLAINNTDAFNYATNVLNNGGLIDYTTATALDVLFNDLQSNSLYTLLEGFYPMLGMTANTQRINANGNTSYNMTLFGGWTFNSMGMKGNGINAVANTSKNYGISSTDLQNTHFSIYGTFAGNTPNNRGDMSIINGSNPYMEARISLNDISGVGGIYEYTFGTYTPIYPANTGDFVVMANDGYNTKAYQNGSLVVSYSDTPYVSSASNLYLGISKYGGFFQYSTNQYGWFSFGGFMSASDMGTYQTIVNTFMTSIGRNTY